MSSTKFQINTKILMILMILSLKEFLMSTMTTTMIGHIILHLHEPPFHMHNVDINAIEALEFSEYLDIVSSYMMSSNANSKDLYVRAQFPSKDVVMVTIKHYSIKTCVDYKVAVSSSTLYVSECWKNKNGCN